MEWACITGKIDFVEALLATGLDVQKRIKIWSVLECICVSSEGRSLQLLDLVLTRADKTKLDDDCPNCGDRPLSQALSNIGTKDRLMKLRRLFDAGADPKFVDRDGCPLIIYHLLMGVDKASAVIVLQHGADYKKESKSGWNAVLAAVSKNNVYFLEQLEMLAGPHDEIWHRAADCFHDDKLARVVPQFRPIHNAATHGHVDILVFLLEHELVPDINIAAGGESPRRILRHFRVDLLFSHCSITKAPISMLAQMTAVHRCTSRCGIAISTQFGRY